MARFVRISNGILRSFDETVENPTIYDEVLAISSTVTTGTPVTLPSAKTYTADELEVYFNTQRLVLVDDYNYVGSGARTQISFTFDLIDTDEIRFRIDRTP